MVWLEINTTNNIKHTVNLDWIMDMYYDRETDMTIIEVGKANMHALYVRGNVLKDFSRVITSTMGCRITKIGE